MKNMKKLLGAMAALGFTTVAATNVVACSNPGGKVTDNDLTKSFNSSYQALGFSSDAGLKQLGLDKQEGSTTAYDFTASKLTEAAVQKWVYAISSKAPVNTNVVADVSKLSAPTKLGVEVAQFSAKDQKGLVVQTDNAGTVSFKITLTLFKSVANDTDPNTFSYKATPTTMDVTINVATQDARQDLNDLTNITIAATDAGNIATFENNLVEQIKLQAKFSKFSVKDLDKIQVVKAKATTDLAISDLVANDSSQTLSLNILTDKDSVNFKTNDKPKAVSVTITKVNKVDISKITNSINVTSPINEVADFTIAVYNELAKDTHYPALLQDVTKLTLTKDDKDKTALKPTDIINNPSFKLIVSATNDNSYYSGSAHITVNLSVNQIDLAALKGKTFSVDKNVQAFDLAGFETALVEVIKADKSLKDFDQLTTKDIDWSKVDAKSIVTNKTLAVTITNSESSQDFTGTATFTVNLTVTKINLDKLTGVTLTGVKEKDLDSFTSALFKELNKQKGYELLSNSDVTINNSKDKPLTADDIQTNPKLEIKLAATDASEFSGTITINVDLTTTK